MDNRRFDISAEGDESLELALRLALLKVPGGQLSHFRHLRLAPEIIYQNDVSGELIIEERPNIEKGSMTLILYWHQDRGTHAFKNPLDIDATILFIKSWLSDVDYGEEPDQDGFNRKGWRIFNEAWGHILGSPYASIAIQPLWAMFGK